MIINAASLSGLYKSFQTTFNQSMEISQVAWPEFATRVPSTTKENVYAWLGAFPFMKEWLGDRKIQNLKLHNYSLINKAYEDTVEVDRDDIEDDQIGVYKPVIQEFGRIARVHPDYLFSLLLASGFSATCYDGQYFFDTDHPVGAGTASNYGGGASVAWYLIDTSRFVKPFIFQDRRAPQFVAMDSLQDENVFMRKKYRYGVDYRATVGFGLWQLAHASKDTLNSTNYAAARAAMMTYKSDNGIPLGIMPNLLMVPPSLEGAGRLIVLADKTPAGATNEWVNTAKLLVNPWLS